MIAISPQNPLHLDEDKEAKLFDRKRKYRQKYRQSLEALQQTFGRKLQDIESVFKEAFLRTFPGKESAFPQSKFNESEDEELCSASLKIRYLNETLAACEFEIKRLRLNKLASRKPFYRSADISGSAAGTDEFYRKFFKTVNGDVNELLQLHYIHPIELEKAREEERKKYLSCDFLI